MRIVLVCLEGATYSKERVSEVNARRHSRRRCSMSAMYEMNGGLKCNKCIVREHIYLSYKSVNLDVRNEMCL